MDVLSNNQLKRITKHLKKRGLIERANKVECETERISNEYTYGWYYRLFYVNKQTGNTNVISKFTLLEMIGCCGIAVSTGSYIEPKYRHCGLGTLLNRIRISVAKKSGYSVLLCTDILDNNPQRKILAKNKWVSLCSFKNTRTGNPISIDCVPLTGEGITRVVDNKKYSSYSWLGKLYRFVLKYFKR